jgi:hypothetical protein
MDEELFREMERRGKRAQQARPGVPPEELLFTFVGDEHVDTVAELNAAGKPTIFACSRTATTPPDCVVPGSARVFCGRCGAEVWLSPATRATRDRITLTEIVCLECLGLMPTMEGKP